MDSLNTANNGCCRILILSHLKTHLCFHCCLTRCLICSSARSAYLCQSQWHDTRPSCVTCRTIAFLATVLSWCCASLPPRLLLSGSRLCSHREWTSIYRRRCRVPVSIHAIACTFLFCNFYWNSKAMPLQPILHSHAHRRTPHWTRTCAIP